MQRFSDDHEALDFIASRIADEAQRDGIPLSEVERKMLYFSETAWTLPDIWEVNDEFDRNYEQGAYERKISQLIKKVTNRAKKQAVELQGWNQAILRLSHADRYLMIMIKQAGLGQEFYRNQSQRGSWRLWVTGAAVVVVFGCVAWCMERLFPPTTSVGRSGVPMTDNSFAFWVAMVSLAATYVLIRFLVGSQRWNGWEVRLLEWIFGKRTR